MAKKGAGNCTKQVTKELIKEQKQRYKNNIDIPKLREFESVVRNSDAMKGIFISTSNFSIQCEKFAADNNISLINGSLLVDYFNQYGINSYILNKR